MKRVDSTQPHIVAVIRQLGGEWIHTSGDPRSGCDGIMLYRGRTYVTEIKNGELSPSRTRLTDNEEKTKAKCERTGAPYLILSSVKQALETLRELR